MMKMSMNGLTIEAHTQQIRVETNVPEADPEWRFVDAAGHGHFRATNGGYPTLRYVEDTPEGFGPDGEEYGPEGHMECTTCGEHIQPGMKPPDPFPRYIAGPTEYNVEAVMPDGRIVKGWLTEEQAQAIQRAPHAEAVAILEANPQQITEQTRRGAA